MVEAIIQDSILRSVHSGLCRSQRRGWVRSDVFEPLIVVVGAPFDD
ncbi:MAG: hypothetical protein J07HR59_00415, partial [Halorubrum sp. J07HR59]